MITLIKILHSVIWLIMVLSIFYIGYSVIFMTFDRLFYFSLVLISTEIIIIIAGSWTCPLTKIARRYTNDESPNFDIFLPKIIAKYNKEIFSVILFVILLIYIINVLR